MLFRAFALASAKQKRARKKCGLRKKKSVNSRFFLAPTVDIRFQSPQPLSRGESKGLGYDVQFSMLERQRGEDTQEKTQGRDVGEETEG